MTLPRISLLITDLDNTLWDWFGAWHASFEPMLLQVAARSGVPQAQLEAEIRVIHQARGTTEYSFLLNDLPSLRALHGDTADILSIYDDAIHTQNRARLDNTKLYPGVVETLTSLKKRHVPIVAYTESVAYWTEWRLRHLSLDGVIDTLYSSPDHDFPEGLTAADVRLRPAEEYGLKATRHHHVPVGVVKPNERVLQAILAEANVPAASAVFLGDSLTKDVVMAQRAGVVDVHAVYGLAQARGEYELLRRVSHWPDTAIATEKAASGHPTMVVPSHSVSDIRELLELFDFRGAT